MPLMDTIEPLITIAPPADISGSAFCKVKSVPFTLIPKYLSNCASVTCSMDAKAPPPALAKRISSRPFCSLMVAKRRSRSARFETSPRTAVTLPPTSFTAASSFRLATARDEDVCAFRNEAFGCGKAKTTAATGDEGDFTREIFVVAHGVCFFLFLHFVCCGLLLLPQSDRNANFESHRNW